MMRGGNAGNDYKTTIQPASTDRSGWVLLLGGGLIVVNFVFGSGAAVSSYLAGKTPLSSVQHPQWGQYVLMALALLILLGIAKTGEVGSNFAVIFLVAVWIVWLLNSQSAVQKIFGQSSSSTSSSSKTTIGKPVAGEK